jgi:hypothetical protein
LQTERNEYIRFGKHTNMEFRYKNLHLEEQQKTPILDT